MVFASPCSRPRAIRRANPLSPRQANLPMKTKRISPKLGSFCNLRRSPGFPPAYRPDTSLKTNGISPKLGSFCKSVQEN